MRKESVRGQSPDRWRELELQSLCLGGRVDRALGLIRQTRDYSEVAVGYRHGDDPASTTSRRRHEGEPLLSRHRVLAPDSVQARLLPRPVAAVILPRVRLATDRYVPCASFLIQSAICLIGCTMVQRIMTKVSRTTRMTCTTTCQNRVAPD